MTRPSMLRCPRDEVHEAHDWLCPWQTPTERWCPGVARTETFYYRANRPRAMDLRDRPKKIDIR
jgi:hypothetical protein